MELGQQIFCYNISILMDINYLTIEPVADQAYVLHPTGKPLLSNQRQSRRTEVLVPAY